MSREVSQRRKFTLADGMILIAAAALALMLTREFGDTFDLLRFDPGWTLETFKVFVSQMTLLSYPSAVVGTWALMILRCLTPKPEQSVLTRQPGTAVFSLFGPPALALHGVLLVVFANFAIRPSVTAERLGLSLALLFAMPAVAVASVWLTLWRIGPISHDRDWIEWAGRFLGVYWMAATGVLTYYVFF